VSWSSYPDYACRYNCDNGGPAPEKLTNAIYKNTTTINEYWIADESLKVDLDKLGRTQFMVQHQDGKFGHFVIEVCLRLPPLAEFTMSAYGPQHQQHVQTQLDC